eukprot:6188601-Pleurochrysis_carterae.AAC.2
MFGLWTGEMKNWARTQMKMWIEKKIKHKARVQRRWDNRGNTHKAFQKWKANVWHDYKGQEGEKENGGGGKWRDKTYGIALE